MAANRYTLRLYDGRKKVAEKETNLDLKDERFLRATLEEMVQEKRGTLRLDLSRYSMTIHNPGALGRTQRRVVVLPSGATEIRAR
jgi:hypothetical protein